MDMMGTPEDRENIARIKTLFPGAEVDAASRADCRKKKKDGNSMENFFARVDEADRVVVVESTKNHLSPGVAAESLHASHDDKQVFLLKNDGVRLIKDIAVVDKPSQKKWAKIKT